MIILEKIKLRNFLSHENTEITFPLGLTVIVGPNGAGKTAIVDAIIHALLGLKTRGNKVDDLIMRGKRELEVELTFKVDSEEYVVKWIREKGGSVYASLRRVGKGYVARSATKVVEEVLKTLKLDSKTLLNSIFIRQGEITSLIDASPGDRKKIIGKMLGLDALEKTWKNLKDIIDYVHDEILEDLENKITNKESELKVLRDSQKKLKEDIESLKKKIDELEKELKKVEEEYESISKEKDILDQKKKEYDELQKMLKEKNGKKEPIENNVKKLRGEVEKCKKAEEEAKKLEPEISKIPLLEKYSEKLRELKDYKKQIAQLEENWKHLDEAESQLRKSLSEASSIIKKHTISVESISLPENLNDLYSKAIKLSLALDNLANQLKKKKSDLSKRIEEVKHILPEPTRQAFEKKLKELEKSIGQLNENLDNMKKEKGVIENNIKRLRKNLSVLDKSEICPLCRSKLTPEHKHKVKQEIEKELENLERKRITLEKELKELESQKEKLEKEKERVLSKSGIIDDIEKTFEEIQELSSKLGKECYKSEKVLEKIADVRKGTEQKLQEIKEKQTLLLNQLKKIEKDLGYEPAKPEEELKELRKKERKYHELKALAKQYEEKLKELKEQERKLNMLKKDIENIQSKIEKLGYDSEHHKRIIDEWREKSNELERKKQEIEDKTSQYKEKVDELKKLEDKIRKLQEEKKYLKKKKDKVDEFRDRLCKIREAFSKDGIQKMLRRRVAPYVSEFATEYVERFNLGISSIRVSEDLDVEVSRGGEVIPISLLSGGEKVAVAIALRLALAKVLAGKLSTVVMDEPTIHLDEERRRELVEVVKNFFRRGSEIPQMIIITHDRELEEVADTLYQIEKVNGVSRVKALTFTEA